MKVIFHSDDANLTPHSTGQILEMWKGGFIEGFSVLANGESLAEIKDCLASAENRPCRLSAHLNLSEGSPILSQDKISSLVSESGNLKLSFGRLIIDWVLKPAHRLVRREQVKLEWTAQVKKLQSALAPRKVSCIDGHGHLHMLPFLFSVAAEVAKESSVPEIRISNEKFYVATLSDLARFRFWVGCLKKVVLNI